MNRREWLGVLALYLVLAVVLAPSAAVGEGVFGYHDFRHHHLPWRSWAAARWALGELPLWASGAGNGFPLLAEGEGGFLYPPTMLLFVLLPDGLALNWSVLGHHVLAAMGLWAFLRASGLRGAAPVLGGLVWGYSGFFVSHALYLGMQNGIAWVGWALLATATRRGWLLALSVGMLGLAGHPQAAAFSGLLILAHAVATVERTGRRRWVGSACLGVVIAAPQLAATWELVRHSTRDGGATAAFATIGAMPLQEWVGFALPYAFGFDRPADVIDTYSHRGASYWGAGVSSWEMCVYVGGPVLVLAALGLRRSRFWTGVLLLSLLLMLGGPLWALVRHLPGFGGFRFPARFAIGAVMALAVLAAQGLDTLRGAARPGVIQRRILWVVVLFTLTTGVGHLGLTTRAGELRALLVGYFAAQAAKPPPPPLTGLAAAALPAPDPEDPARIPAKVEHILADLGRSTAPGSPRLWVPVLLLVVTAAALRRPRVLVALVALDLLAFGRDYHPTVPAADVGRAPPWLAPAMTEPGGWRLSVLDRRVHAALDDELLSASLGLPLGTNDVILPSPLLLMRNDALLAAAGLDVGDRGIRKVERWLEHAALGRRLSLRWIVSVHDVPGLVPRVRGRYNLFEDPDALPRARVVPCVLGVATPEAALAATLAEDPRRTVVVEGAGTGCGGGAFAEAEITAYTDTDVTIAAAGPGTLVLGDTWYPGWTATVDGVRVPIERADLIYRAVTLPPGEHIVRLVYQPRWLWGLLVVAVVALSSVLVASVSRLRPAGWSRA
ncbi:MAG: hypothetical protein EXR71_00800 [Myxococcales bacterium]|nr:hypothetical protein [Myxococcales bacterium]